MSSPAQVSRTPSGIRNEHLFYPGEFLVFVEDKDVCFSAQLVPAQVGEAKAHFKPVGGKLELENRIKEFAADGGRSIVAMDAD